jgi:predicted anti-sigma-YlaC factor YlaD
MLDVVNTLAAGVLFVAAAWAALCPRVHAGLVGHIGLVLVAVGFFGLCLIGVQGTLTHGAARHASAFVHVGLLACAAEYCLRLRRHGKRRRASDWVDRRR